MKEVWKCCRVSPLEINRRVFKDCQPSFYVSDCIFLKGTSLLFIYLTVKMCQSLSRVRLFAAAWAVTHQALLSMGFSRQEYWSR